ncbi:MAG: thioredoxin family protein [Gemmatimonadales bacterium]|nr:thioredoxin family protein [Gemmatimonadales bacterium]
MAATPSTMLPLGTELPEFALPNVVDGTVVSSDKYRKSIALVVMFICNHCPYVKHVVAELGRITRDYMPKGIAFVAINANDADAYPDDGPEPMKALAVEQGWRFPYLFDETQDVARAFKAACTPDLYVFDEAQRLVYRGQLDDSRPNSGIPVTGKDLRAALDAIIAGKDIPGPQKPSLGCNIKWK